MLKLHIKLIIIADYLNILKKMSVTRIKPLRIIITLIKYTPYAVNVRSP